MAELAKETTAIYACIRSLGPIDVRTICTQTGYQNFLVDAAIRAMLALHLIYQSGLTPDESGPVYMAFDALEQE